MAVSQGSAENVATAPGWSPPWFAISFIVLALIPTLASVYYFAWVATDQYTAEARFAVRSLAEPDEKLDAGVIQMMPTSQDSFVVKSFIQSDELLKRLTPKLNYKEIFTRPEADILSRFDPKDSDQEFLKYWEKHVVAYIDGPSGIVTLTVRTFRPEDSLKLATAILSESEQLVNEMSDRAKRDLLKSFGDEVTRTGALYQNALEQMTKYRQGAGVLSPEIQAKGAVKILTELIGKKLELESRIFVLKGSESTESPTYKQMVIAEQGLDQQIKDMQLQLSGSSDTSLANIITTFSKLETDRMVAEKLYEAARSNYDLALADSSRKALYLTVFVKPSLPDEALYPKRIMNPLMIFLGLFVSWATLALIWASIEDHRL